MEKNKKIYLIRHCQPELPEGTSICLGRKDIPLSETGLKQAENLKEYFSELNIETIYSSPLIRAFKTTKIISNGHIPYESINDFAELDVGKWDGMPFYEIKEKYPQEYEERGKNFETYVIEGGESMLSCKERNLSAFNEVVNESNGDIAIVSHAGVIRLILAEILNKSILESFSFKLDYGSVSIISRNKNKFNVIKIG